MTVRSLAAWCVVACAPDLDPGAPGAADTGGTLVQTREGGVTSVTVDATSESAWVPYDFLSAAQVAPGHLQFQRYRIRLGEGLEAAWIDGADFDALAEAPVDGWSTDADPIVADEDYVFNAWYDYDEATHALSPADRVAVVRGDGLLVKLAFDAYYDDAGTPAFVAFRWSHLSTEF